MTAFILLVPDAVLVDSDPRSLAWGAAIAIAGDRVAAVGPASTLRLRFPAAEAIELPGCLAMPGFVNAHQHGRGLTALQHGFADDYLELALAARQDRGPLDAYALARAAAVEMLRNGVTCTIQANASYAADYEAEIRGIIRAYDETGMRAAICIGAQDRGRIVSIRTARRHAFW